jgi:hypothetical protein
VEVVHPPRCGSLSHKAHLLFRMWNVGEPILGEMRLCSRCMQKFSDRLLRRSRHSACVCATLSAGTPMNTERERSGVVPAMAIRLNQEAVEQAQNLIKGRQYERNSD